METEMRGIPVKVKIERQIGEGRGVATEFRRFRLENPPSFSSLLNQISLVFNDSMSPSLTYQDPEGDVIKISSDDELREACSSSPSQSGCLLIVASFPPSLSSSSSSSSSPPKPSASTPPSPSSPQPNEPFRSFDFPHQGPNHLYPEFEQMEQPPYSPNERFYPEVLLSFLPLAWVYIREFGAKFLFEQGRSFYQHHQNHHQHQHQFKEENQCWGGRFKTGVCNLTFFKGLKLVFWLYLAAFVLLPAIGAFLKGIIVLLGIFLHLLIFAFLIALAVKSTRALFWRPRFARQFNHPPRFN